MFYTKREKDNYVKYINNLIHDFFNKCYICECEFGMDYECEHRIPKTANKKDKNLSKDWNLFLACSRCNGSGKKSDEYFEVSSLCKCGNGYLGIIDCTNCDPNKYITLKFDDDNKTITVTKKLCAPCIDKFTIPLLENIYCVDKSKKMKDAKFYSLRNEISRQHDICNRIVSELRDRIEGKAPKHYIEKLKDDLVWLIRPESPFSAFKRTYLEEAYEKTKNGAIRLVLKEVLDNPIINPTSTIDCV